MPTGEAAPPINAFVVGGAYLAVPSPNDTVERPTQTLRYPIIRRRPIPVEVRSHVGAALAACAADKARLNVGQPQIIRSPIRGGRQRRAALVVLMKTGPRHELALKVRLIND